ncbi:polysaccharide biosynthesis tyrosine autokinase [Lichenifustis flavocetrariae]|uniref:non-specific protein-tyrosine kinase n=1 Tax=Lichenifustis flavocetrariae TaxID=2949735 RepID=A0AA41Z5W4_9HYPH|nr:polysaccharide biosynthesis tyrosine autokinase [Lichenifustis flavocetrariae]MCW6511078.1 polysaccharide biosynthesis tyrosine autokinase [Lichenifustis flavocetrariae]
MLQTSKGSVQSLAYEPHRDFDAGSVVDAFQAMLGLVRRHWPLFVLLPALLLGCGVAYLVVTPPVYVAQATMVLDVLKVHAFQQQSANSDQPEDAVAIQTQLEVLRSDAIATAVVKSLQLQNDPEFVRSREGLSDEQAQAIATKAVANSLVVSRVPATYAVMIGFQSHDPEKAARVANATVDAYVSDQLDAKFQATRRASVWLQDRLNELGVQSSGAEKAVADFKAKNNIVAADGRLMNEQQMSEASSQLASARAATAEAKARLDRINDVMKQAVPDASTTEALHNEIIVRLRQQILDLQARQQLFATRYGAKHQATLNIQDQIAGMQRSITDEMKKVAEGARSDYVVAQAREAALTANLTSSVTVSESTNQSLVRLRELQSAAQSSRTLYDNFLQRYMDAVQQESYPATEARLITPATRPYLPSKPNKTGTLGAALAGGLLLSFGIAALRELMDGVFRSAGQVEKQVALGCIATLPKVKRSKSLLLASAASPASVDRGSRRIVAATDSLYRHVIDEPFSAFAEGLRSIKIAVDVANVGKSHQVIGVTSTLPNEGKSTISANFAHLIAHAGSRVLLVDADLRSPSLSRLFAPDAAGGLIDVVAGRRNLAELIRVDEGSQLDFLPAGAAPKLLHTNEILGSESMRAFFAAARNHYDYIVVDLSPLAPVVDARATTHFIDSYVYVVEWGSTKIDVVETVLKDSREIYDATLGIVLNKADLSVLGRYDRHRGAGYNKKYYKKYGYMS